MKGFSKQALSTSWFQRSPELVARELIGSCMQLQVADGIQARMRIVETEAYLSANDAACHAANGRSPRNTPMFEAGGILYVYQIYGIHYCANVVTEREGEGSAVLLRAAHLLSAEDWVRAKRGAVEQYKLLQGPGNFCRALGLNTQHNYLNCSSAELSFYAALEPPQVLCGTRIGINRDADLPLRFFAANEPCVSAHRRGRPV